MEEDVAWIFPGHVRVDGDNVDAASAEGFEDRLKFGFEAGKVTVHYGVVIGTGEGGPGGHAHFFSDLAAAGHFRFPAEDEFYHAVLFCRLATQHGDERSGGDAVFLRNPA